MHVMMLSLLLLVSLASSVKHCANAIDARGLRSASSITSSDDANDKKKRRLEEQFRGEEDESITSISTHWEDAAHGEDATNEHDSLEDMAVHVSYEDICECCLP